MPPPVAPDQERPEPVEAEALVVRPKGVRNSISVKIDGKRVLVHSIVISEEELTIQGKGIGSKRETFRRATISSNERDRMGRVRILFTTGREIEIQAYGQSGDKIKQALGIR